MGFGADRGDVAHDGVLDRREELAVEVVQERDGPQERDDQPRGARERGRRWALQCWRDDGDVASGVNRYCSCAADGSWNAQTSGERMPGNASPLGMTHVSFH